MTTPPPAPPRQGFKSKTPIGANAARRRAWGPATRHQYSGWKFQIRRISNGAALHDTRMLADPLRRQGQALSIGSVLGVVLLLGAFVLSIFKPAGVSGNDAVLADRATGALYVLVNGDLHPALNLTSARLIVDKPVEPKTVKGEQIDKHPRGNTLGIPQAPARMNQSPGRESRWMVCDAADGPMAGTTVIVGDPVAGGGRASTMASGTAILARGGEDDATWLIWDGKRARIDLQDSAVSAAVGIGIDAPRPRPIDRALLNLIPESPPLRAPFVGNAGDPPRFGWVGGDPAPVVGSVVVDHQDGQVRNYVVTAEGLQAITPVVAAILRATNSHGLIEPPELTPDQTAKLPVATPIPVDYYPEHPLSIVDPVTDPIACAQWVKLDSAPTSTLTVLAGQSLPIGQGEKPVPLPPAPGAAARIVAPAGVGYFVQVTGQQPRSATREAQFWVSDLGLRYGIEGAANEHPVEALGLVSPALPVPWAVLMLLAPGPTLSKTDALITH